MSKKKDSKDMFYWTNGDDYLFPVTWIGIGEWNITKIKEDKNNGRKRNNKI